MNVERLDTQRCRDLPAAPFHGPREASQMMMLIGHGVLVWFDCSAEAHASVRCVYVQLRVDGTQGRTPCVYARVVCLWPSLCLQPAFIMRTPLHTPGTKRHDRRDGDEGKQAQKRKIDTKTKKEPHPAEPGRRLIIMCRGRRRPMCILSARHHNRWQHTHTKRAQPFSLVFTFNLSAGSANENQRNQGFGACG